MCTLTHSVDSSVSDETGRPQSAIWKQHRQLIRRLSAAPGNVPNERVVLAKWLAANKELNTSNPNYDVTRNMCTPQEKVGTSMILNIYIGDEDPTVAS